MIALLAVTVFQVNAQDNTATVTATGTVLNPITVTGTGISFGTEIFPGVDKAVAKTAVDAARFEITGEGGKDVIASFTLPTDLTHTDGTTAMPIVFSDTDAGHSTTDDASTITADQDPNADITGTLDATNENLYLWLGGTLQPAIGQIAGDYTADITVDVVYPSN